MLTVSRHDAAAALREIEQAQAHSANLDDYERAAPHFLIWGVLWAAAYTLNDFFPRQGGPIWAVVVPIGVIAGLFAMRGERKGVRWRYAAAMGAVFVFLISAVVIMWPVSERQIAAFIPLIVALAYVLKGIWSGIRYVGAGIGIAALTLVGFLLVKNHFLLWMAAVGGTSLILAGVWFRRV